MENNRRLSSDTIIDTYRKTSERYPDILKIGDLPLGSRGYENCEAAAIVLSSEKYFKYFDDPFNMEVGNSEVVSELIVQAYVHNVRGYCRSVLNVVKYLIRGKEIKCFYPLDKKI